MKKIVSFLASLAMVFAMVTMNMATVDAAEYTLNDSNPIIELSLKKGVYVTTATYTGSAAASAYVFTSYDDAYNYAMSNTYSSNYLTSGYFYFEAGGATKSSNIKVGATQKAYLTLQRKGGTATFKMTRYAYGGTLTKGKYFKGSGLGDSDNVTNYKVVVKKSGYLNVYAKTEGNYGLYLCLKNSKKKSLTSSYQWVSNDGSTATVKGIAVKKGTYYLGVKSFSQYYQIKYTFTSRSQGGGASKAKAVKIKSKKYKKGLIYPTGTKRWFKFYNTKKRTLKCTIKISGLSGNSGGATVTAYAGSKKLGSTTLYAYTAAQTHVLTLTNSTTYGKANKGWYYIKISKKGKAAAQYQIKFN